MFVKNRMKPFIKVSRAMASIIERYEWVRLIIGLAGNFLFIIGAVSFLGGYAYSGWFFLIGSTGMFINTLGDLLTKTEYGGKTHLTDIGRYVQFNNNIRSLRNYSRSFSKDV